MVARAVLRRAALSTAILIAAAAINGAWLARLPLRGTPDLLLLVVVSAARTGGLETAAVIGAVAGFLRDLMGGSPLGLYMLAYLLTGASVGAAMPVVNTQHRMFPAAAAAVATVLLSLIAGIVVTVTGVAPVRWPDLLRSTAIATLANALLARPVDAALARTDRLATRRPPARVLGPGIRR